MKRVLFAVLLLLPQTASADKVRIYAVDIYGEPQPKVEMVLGGTKVTADDYGMAEFDVTLADERGELVLPNSQFSIESVTLEWNDDKQRLDVGFVVILWTLQELRDVADSIVVSVVPSTPVVPVVPVRSAARNPVSGGIQLTAQTNLLPQEMTYYAVALRSLNSGKQPVVAAKTVGTKADVERWMATNAPNLPAARMPRLAQQLYQNVKVGTKVPADYNDQLVLLREKIEQLNQACQMGMRFPEQAARLPAVPVQPGGGGGGQVQPPIPGTGRVIVTNHGDTTCSIVVNGILIAVGPRESVSQAASYGTSVMTQFPDQPNSTANWNQWSFENGEYVLHIGIRCSVVPTSTTPPTHVTPTLNHHFHWPVLHGHSVFPKLDFVKPPRQWGMETF